MLRRSREVSLSDYRSVLRTKGDIAVGAFARRQRRRRIAVAFAGVVLISAAIALLCWLWPTTANPHSDTHPVVVRCIKCKREEVLQLRAGDVGFPLMCPVCQERTCWQVWECRNCGQQFVPPATAAKIVCPRCRSESVGAAEVLPSASAPR